MPKVLNKNLDKIPRNAIYIGRPSKWGNPFIIGQDGDREEVLAKYKEHIEQLLTYDSFKNQLEELRGRDLVCWCAPNQCHGHILLEYANKET